MAVWAERKRQKRVGIFSVMVMLFLASVVGFAVSSLRLLQELAVALKPYVQ